MSRTKEPAAGRVREGAAAVGCAARGAGGRLLEERPREAELGGGARHDVAGRGTARLW